jgi:copper(I)-binding protein
LLSIFAAALFGLVATGAAEAHDYHLGSLHIIHPWSREIPKGSPVASGYLVIENNGTTPDRLIGGSAEIAGKFQIHEMKTENGVMKMRQLEKGIEIPPGKTVKLEPSGYHIMLMDLKSAPQQGKSFNGTLVFEKAGKIDVKFVVAPLGATTGESPKGMNHMDHMNHMDMKH